MSRKIRWSGPVIMTETDASDYGVPVGSLIVWAGEADDAGHVDEDEVRILEDHDATKGPHGWADNYGPETAAWVEASVAEMLAELT